VDRIHASHSSSIYFLTYRWEPIAYFNIPTRDISTAYPTTTTTGESKTDTSEIIK
jgi:hypothetical protein